MWKSSLESGKDVILEIEIQGALKVRKSFPGYVAFIRDSADSTRAEKTVWSEGEQRRMEVIESRMERAM